jgi:hypothetical protein
MGFKQSLAMGLLGSVLSISIAWADRAPVRVIPGRPGVPVVINGYDASYSVVEGDWGLARPGHMPPAIVSGPLITPAPYRVSPYFPSGGPRPGYGRREVEPSPDRRLPPPAPSYYREWGTQSPLLPATIDPEAAPSPMIGAPIVAWPDHRLHRDHRSRIHRHYRDEP